MGLPQIEIEFKAKAVSAVKRSAMGITALILRDATEAEGVATIKSVEDLDSTAWTPENADYINKTLLGNPSKVVVVRIGEATLIADALKKLNSIKFNYLAMPDATELEATTITSWIKSKRTNDKKTYKAVVANQEADSEGIINFTTEDILAGGTTYTAQQYTARIAGILAGIPFTRSSTYYELAEVDSITESETPNEDIDNGQLILINDGENIKIGRGVNSLTTLTVTKKEDYKKIKVLEVMDIIKDDIRDTFDKEYVGKVINVYDNQILFVTAVNAYFKILMTDQILDPSFENISFIDVDAQRLAWESIGTDTTNLSDTQIREMSFGSTVFLGGQIKIADAMEDLKFDILTV
ncbi:phage tail sheath subtilisin-like domain-containing protein [Lysinibacillus sphaericus]|uniref:phage tail sheath subtilisin-like domain-containing protein n=1 Tax=Lysinibacillus sphaericus TaxID=1421 RepID=UPI003CFDC062